MLYAHFDDYVKFADEDRVAWLEPIFLESTLLLLHHLDSYASRQLDSRPIFHRQPTVNNQNYLLICRITYCYIIFFDNLFKYFYSHERYFIEIFKINLNDNVQIPSSTRCCKRLTPKLFLK